MENKQELDVLKTVSKPVVVVDDTTKGIAKNLVRVAASGKTVGLSAIQLGYPIRVFVINMFSGLFDADKDLKTISGSDHIDGRSLVCINPEIISFSGETVTLFEGCLSAETYGMIGISRPGHVDLKYTNLAGGECVVRTYGWLARCVQHEMDHLNGVLLANVVDNIKNHLEHSVSEEDYSSVHILLLDNKRMDSN
ncbi:peptide deformylase [Anaplasma platys]|uniref:peptide deformylase n=1 Tax=Anaplasma platys TaxID=949 RepID=UPI001F159954|nr:peptide deformylase [Anaplasma platys]